MGNDNNEWASLTGKLLWTQLKQELKAYYDYDLTSGDVDGVLEAYGLQKVSLLRGFCIKTGVQILLRDYNLDSKNKLIFFEEDILNIFPVVKHINPRATDAYNFYTTGKFIYIFCQICWVVISNRETRHNFNSSYLRLVITNSNKLRQTGVVSGQSKIQQGLLKDGYELISEALNLLNNVYGAMHPEIAQCLRMIARLNYIMGEHAEAMAYQQKAVLMSERVNGIDHPYTITEYVSFFSI